SERPADHVDRLAAQAARKIELADAFGQRARSQHEQERILADEYDDLHRLPALEILVAVNAAVLALGDLAADRLAVIDLIAIGAEVEPAGVRVLRDDAVRRADIARLVSLVMARHGKLEDVALVALDDVLEDRSALDGARLERSHLLHPRVIALHDVDLALVRSR